MAIENRPIRNFRKTAYWCHVAVALIVCLVVAMQVHLTVIKATPEVVGAGAFLVFMWVGFPAIALAIWAIVSSVRASDRELLYLTSALIILIHAAVLSAPLVLVTALEVLYVALVVRLGVVWWRNRRQEIFP